MTVMQFYQLVGALVAANLLTFMFGAFVWITHRREREGRDPMKVGLGVALCGLVPLAVVALAIFIAPLDGQAGASAPQPPAAVMR